MECDAWGRNPGILAFGLSTAKEYDYAYPYTGFDYVTTYDSGPSIVFGDSIRLVTYPIAFGYGVRSKVIGSIFFAYGQGETDSLHITWLGKTYSGVVKTDSAWHVSVIWQNSVVSVH